MIPIILFTILLPTAVPGFQQLATRGWMNHGPRTLTDYNKQRCRPAVFGLHAKNTDDDEYDDDDLESLEDLEPPDEEEDWRDFRAKLVMQEDTSEKKDKEKTPKTSSYAYESGYVIETGSIILSRPHQHFGHGLNQQYFHKCVMLVLSHDPKTFTQGIILNRPTDLVLGDDDFSKEDGSPLKNASQKNKWRVWFGGDVKWIDDDPEIFCLHRLKGGEAKKVSMKILKDVQCTTFDGARHLVNSGLATTEDFWTFIGYAGWSPGQLMSELERESWYMVSADSRTILKELEKQSAGADVRDAGVDIWRYLMQRIGKEGEVSKNIYEEETFEDLMLKEWARERLLLEEESSKNSENEEINIDDLIQMATNAAKHGIVQPGSIVRGGAPQNNSFPFLLSDQEFHKSLVLVIDDNEQYTIGAILNLPSTEKIGFQIQDKLTLKEDIIQTPQRFGGRYGVKSQTEGKPAPTIWLHCHPSLRNNKIGTPISEDTPALIWKCSPKEAADAIAKNLASPRDFLILRNFCIWEKVAGEFGGIQADLISGNFEVVPKKQIPKVWDLLLGQEVMTAVSMEKNLDLSFKAWEAAASDDSKTEDEGCVHETSVRVRDLADDALRNWIATVILGDESVCRRRYSTSSSFE